MGAFLWIVAYVTGWLIVGIASAAVVLRSPFNSRRQGWRPADDVELFAATVFFWPVLLPMALVFWLAALLAPLVAGRKR